MCLFITNHLDPRKFLIMNESLPRFVYNQRASKTGGFQRFKDLLCQMWKSQNYFFHVLCLINIFSKQCYCLDFVMQLTYGNWNCLVWPVPHMLTRSSGSRQIDLLSQSQNIFLRLFSTANEAKDYVLMSMRHHYRGLVNWTYFCLKIIIPKENYWILRINVMGRCQKVY